MFARDCRVAQAQGRRMALVARVRGCQETQTRWRLLGESVSARVLYLRRCRRG